MKIAIVKKIVIVLEENESEYQTGEFELTVGDNISLLVKGVYRSGTITKILDNSFMISDSKRLICVDDIDKIIELY